MFELKVGLKQSYRIFNSLQNIFFNEKFCVFYRKNLSKKELQYLINSLRFYFYPLRPI